MTIPKESSHSSGPLYYEDEYLDQDEAEVEDNFGTLGGKKATNLLDSVEDSYLSVPDDKKEITGDDQEVAPEGTSNSPDKVSKNSSKKSIGGDKSPMAMADEWELL